MSRPRLDSIIAITLALASLSVWAQSCPYDPRCINNPYGAGSPYGARNPYDPLYVAPQ